MKIAVWFSCGAASAVAAKLTLEKYPEAEIHVLNNPVVEEGPDNQRFLRDVADWLEHPIESVLSKKYPTQSAEDVWNTRQYMSGTAGAPCTLELKKYPRQEWETQHRPDWMVLGFTAEEKTRATRFRQTERENLLTPLIDDGLTKQDCFDIVTAAGLVLPEAYRLGYPNANCIGCVKATSPTYWNWVRETHPEVFEKRARQSDAIGAKLVRVNNVRIPLSELDPTAKGRPMKNYDVDCGIFCEER